MPDAKSKAELEAEDFIKALRSFDLVVTEEGKKERIKATYWYGPEEPQSRIYSEWLMIRIAQFEQYDSFDASSSPSYPVTKEQRAQFVKSWFDRGLTSGYLGQGKGLVAKWEKSEQDNRELRRKLGVLIRHYRRCSEEKLGLENQVSELGRQPITVGSVQSKVEGDVFDPKEFDEFEEN